VVSVRLDDEPREALEALARRWKLSRSATVARLALEALARGE
jgi:predicted transcriptional regulator